MKTLENTSPTLFEKHSENVRFQPEHLISTPPHFVGAKGRLPTDFFTRDVLIVAPELLGKILVCKVNNDFLRYRITETEAYRGVEDLACHASKGRTSRTETMYHTGGAVYVYLIYGMYWMLNIVTGRENDPQAVLIRGFEGLYGPGRITRKLQIDKSFYTEDVTISHRIWIEDDGFKPLYERGTRIGVDYAGEWKDKLWRFYIHDFHK